MVDQLNAKRADAAAMAELLTKPKVVDENQAVLAVQSAGTIDREPRQLRINEAQRAWLSEELDTEDNEAPEQHDNDAKEAHVGGSGTGAIDLIIRE